MMKMSHHGGKCCGIKTIFNMGNGPDRLQPAICAVTDKAVDGTLTSIGLAWYKDARPEETGLERLKVYIEFYKSMRSSGILEVVIQTPNSTAWGNGQGDWIPVLEKLGFKEVNAWTNSNTDNCLHVFNLNIGEKKSKKAKAVEVSHA